jgi:hypothetical protein
VTDHEPGRNTNVSLPAQDAQPTAIGYLRTDLCGHRGFTTARLRLAAIAHGYRLRRLVELPADPSPDHLTTLRTTLEQTGADAVIVATLAHLSAGQLRALRKATSVIVDGTALPEERGLLARLRTVFS